MVSKYEEIAYSLFLPVSNDLEPDRAILSFLDSGGKAILFGEYAEEFATGRMSAERIAFETAEKWQEVVDGLRARAGSLIVACDGDISAVNRLHAVAGELPALQHATEMPSEILEDHIARYATKAAALGVSLLLSPTSDIVKDGNRWLRNRTLGLDPRSVERIVGAYVRGAQRSGVMTALKYFPGHPTVIGNPADEDAHVPDDLETILAHSGGFKAGIKAGAKGVVMGSAVFDAVHPPTSASLSAPLIQLLRHEFGFEGLVITLDLDHRASQADRTIEETCVLGLEAGADLLLLSPHSVPSIPAVARFIAEAVDSGRLSVERLEAAVASVQRASHRPS